MAGSAAAARLYAFPPRPRIFVLLIAEQFRADYLRRFEPLFGPGGFRRLIEEGSYLPDCRMNASAFSASGLATLASGAYPQVHGIVADTWFNTESGKIERASAALSRAGTLADEVSLADERNRAVTIAPDFARASLAARGTAHPGVSNSILALDRAVPGEPYWVERFRQSHLPERFKNARWQGILAETGAPPLRILAVDAANPGEFTALYNASPFAQETQFDLLRAALAEEHLGQGPAFDFVTVALNASALLGYQVGADSPLMREMVLHLDRQIEATLELLTKQAGLGKFGLGFAAAHGSPDAGGKAIDGVTVATAVDKALASAYDSPNTGRRFVARYVYPFLYLDRGQLQRVSAGAREARRKAGEAAMQIPGVAGYYTADGDCSVSGEWRRRFENSFHTPRSGDLMLAYEPNAVEEYGHRRGISYGSLYNYDVQTPLLLYGPQFRARTFEEPVETIDVAPTLARAFGIAAPSSSMGRVLGQVFAPARKAGP